MTKIIRTPTYVAGGLTADEQRRLRAHADLWISRAMRTTPADPAEVEMFASDNPLIAWLKVNRPTTLEHRRPHDTHAPIRFSPGVYEVRRQREYTPEGWRQVAD